jgi:hypothetical protein
MLILVQKKYASISVHRETVGLMLANFVSAIASRTMKLTSAAALPLSTASFS